jgi:anti-sigma factor RsiW
MNCEEFWNQMPELPSVDGRVDAHVTKCSRCAALLERQQRLASGLRTMANDMRAVAAPPRLEVSLLNAFRREMMPARPRPARVRWMPAFSWAAAAAVVIGMGVLWMAPRHQPPVAPVTHHKSAASTVELASLADDGAEDDGFIPLPNAERVGPNDDVHVVQMELPRSAMLVVGYDVSPERVSEPVEAEVILGPDGLARAVRFMDPDGTN